MIQHCDFNCTFKNKHLFYISGNISGSPISYTAHAFNLISGTSFNSTVGLSSCKEGIGCPIELPSTYCSQSTIISVTISAANILGEGPRSNPFMIGTNGEIVGANGCVIHILNYRMHQQFCPSVLQ